ncbi:tryptophan synthase beta subunit-like PLP-dependent enzyme [Aspergillus germanicus]
MFLDKNLIQKVSSYPFTFSRLSDTIPHPTSNQLYSTATYNDTHSPRNRLRGPASLHSDETLHHQNTPPGFPIHYSHQLRRWHSTTLLFKTENFQRTGAFKIRGAMAKLSATGNGTTSSGNHGIGAACAATTLGRHLTVGLPDNVVQAKLEKIKAYGVEAILHGVETGLAEKYAQSLAMTGEYTENDTAGVGGGGVDNVFVAMGGGGLISGIGSVMRVLSPSTKVYGISAVNSKALAASMAAGKVVEVEHRGTLADAVAGGIDGDSITIPLAREVVDVVVECEEEEIREAIRELAFREGMLVEGAAVLAFAGFKKVMNETGVKGRTSVVVLSGGNVDVDVMKNVLV